ncbi:hypothetical protein [Actinomadura hibisca]|uniref:hypothetical protein n=1 Tax=Actinomadura hibisca TaxID=68565 RepID=UPI0008370D59|nr:hypothetical protein [Actinomadura hibisca]
MTVTAEVLAQALEIVKAAYHEAMGRAGMLKGKIEEVHVYAESQLIALDREDDVGVGPPS